MLCSLGFHNDRQFCTAYLREASKAIDTIVLLFLIIIPNNAHFRLGMLTCRLAGCERPGRSDDSTVSSDDYLTNGFSSFRRQDVTG